MPLPSPSVRLFPMLLASVLASGLAAPAPALAGEASPAQSGPAQSGPAQSGPAASVPAAQPAPAPRLIVAISVDQFSADLFAQYRRRFIAGLARLQDGAVFPSGYQAHAATETCPGHSTLLTGARPARTGIIANYWFDPELARADKRVYCVEDERDADSTSSRPVRRKASGVALRTR